MEGKRRPSGSTDRATSGILVVFFDAPATPAFQHWLFGAHAQRVITTIPGVWRSRSFEVLNPLRPGEPHWLTVLETDDIEATWRHRWLVAGDKSMGAASKRGVVGRHEFFAKLVNDRSKRAVT